MRIADFVLYMVFLVVVAMHLDTWQRCKRLEAEMLTVRYDTATTTQHLTGDSYSGLPTANGR